MSCLRNLVTQVCGKKKAGETCPACSQEGAGCLKLKYGNGCASGPSARPHSQERAHLERLSATWSRQCPVAIIKEPNVSLGSLGKMEIKINTCMMTLFGKFGLKVLVLLDWVHFM